jgi:hypothetical protein
MYRFLKHLRPLNHSLNNKFEIELFMKRKFTAVLWAGAMLTLACVNVPTVTGQEKAAVKTGAAVANVPNRDVQLRTETVWLPESAIVYSPNGEKRTRHVYMPGENYGQYTWENGAWKPSDTEPEKWFFMDAIYDREAYSEQTGEVSYETSGGQLRLFFPAKFSYFYHFTSSSTDFEPGYDANGNLTSFMIIYGAGEWEEFTVAYNTDNNPVSIEGRSSFEGREFFLKAHYEYNDFGYVTLVETYDYIPDTETWAISLRETAEYDAQGKILVGEQYSRGELSCRSTYEYYDGYRFSSITWKYFGSYESSSFGREWKYGTDGNLGAAYYYSGSELALEYYVIFYPNTLPSAVEPVSGSVAARVWASGGQLYITATSAGTAQVYTVAGQLTKTVALTAGETAVTTLPTGVYIVVAEGRTWKVSLMN